MKILQITNRIPYPLNDGGNIATYNVTKYLSCNGHKVVLAALNTSKHFQDPSVLGNIAEVHTSYLYNHLSSKDLISGIFQRMPFNIARFYSPDFVSLLEGLLKKESFDIIQLEGIYMALYVPFIRKISNAPLLLRSHNIEHEIWRRYAENEKNPVKKIYLSVLSKKIKNYELEQMHLFDGIVAITERDRSYYKEQGYKGRLVTINAGVDTEKFRPSAHVAEPDSVSFLGSLEWVPNVQGLQWLLEEVWPLVLKQVPTADFHIAGKNPPEWLKNLNKKNVVFHGMVPDAVDFLNRYEIVVVPLFSGGGMRLKMIEAMALGKPVISTLVGAEGIDVVNGKHAVVAQGDKNIFAAALVELLKDREKKEEIGRNALMLVQEKYNWQTIIRKFESFYSQFHENPRRIVEIPIPNR